MGWLTALTGYAAPLFLMLSPLFSYGDQVLAMQRNRSSAGFSLDIPLIMLVASILRIFYYPGAHFDIALLVQSLIMVVVQLVLLKVALDHRPPPSAKGGEAAVPFSGLDKRSSGFLETRPFNFWQWRSPKPYWQFLLYLFIALTVLELVLAPFGSIYSMYSSFIGCVGLTVEAFLPLPQIRANAQARSCRGFRPSVLVNWLVGDAMKMFWFFTSSTTIPWSFKACGLFQAACDSMLGLQYFVYGNGSGVAGGGSGDIDDGFSSPVPLSSFDKQQPSRSWRPSAGSGLETPPTGRRMTVSEKEF